MNDTALLVFTTCGSAAEADGLARGLVEDRLAACVNVVPQVLSTYRWKGKVEQAEEWLLLIKTTTQRYPQLQQALRERSTYDLPEVLAIRPETGSADYLAWVREAVGEAVRNVKE